MIRVAIADDHQMFVDGVKALLSDEPGIVMIGEAETGKQVMDEYAAWNPDVLLMDINMPEMDGLEAMAELFKIDSNARVILLTMFKDHAFINRAMQEGAYGYVMKNAGREELVTAITRVSNGEKHFGEEALQAYLSQFSPAKKEKERQGPEHLLTKREMEILKLVAEALTSQEIADQLFISLHTVETHRKNIMSKLDLKNTAGLTRYAIQYGVVELD